MVDGTVTEKQVILGIWCSINPQIHENVVLKYLALSYSIKIHNEFTSDVFLTADTLSKTRKKGRETKCGLLQEVRCIAHHC